MRFSTRAGLHATAAIHLAAGRIGWLENGRADDLGVQARTDAVKTDGKTGVQLGSQRLDCSDICRQPRSPWQELLGARKV
jgi:uncharacterized protein (DUF2345 family)